MDFSLGPDERRFRQELIDFVNAVLPVDWEGPTFAEEEIEDDYLWDEGRRVARELASRGWLGITFPREYGGQQRPHAHDMIFKEEMAYHRVPGIDFAGIGMAGPTILYAGTAEQKERHVPRITGGEVQWCQGFSEPDAGSDLSALKTRAVLDGDHFRVDGQKVWTTAANRADWMLLLCRTNPEAPARKGLSMMLVDMKSPGISVRPLAGVTGGYSLNEVYFDNVLVPKENLLGEMDGGWKLALAMMRFERSGIERVACARRMLDDIIDFVQESGEHEHPAFRVSRQRLAELAIECEVARLLAYRVNWMQDNGLNSICEASMSKVTGSELMQKVADTGTKVLGLYGQLTKDSKHARILGRLSYLYLVSIGRTIAAGTSEIQRTTIAGVGLGLPINR